MITTTAVQLSLPVERSEALRRAVRVRLDELRQEWSRTDDRSYRHELRQELDLLEEAAKDLDAAEMTRRSA